MATNSPIDEEGDTFWEKYGVIIVVGLLVLGVASWFLLKPKKKAAPAIQQERFTMIALPPPPPRVTPPPPTPPPPQVTPPPVDQKMEEQVPVDAAKEPDKPDEPKADEPPLGTNNVGEGPGDNFGLAAGGGNGGFGGKGKGTGGSGSKFGWYAAKVQSRIQDALQKNKRTKNASMRVEVRIWPDLTGRITRAEMKTSTGDLALDQTIQNEVLNGLQLPEPPPADMKLPIVMRLTAKRPG